MTLLHPDWLWLLTLSIPLVLLHLRLRRKVRVVVPSLLAYDPQTLAEASPRAAGLRPRDLAGLLLELGALTALSVAAAGPVEGSEPRGPGSLAIVLDGSASTMAAGRFEEMRGIARKALDSVGPDTPVTLLLAAGEPRVLADTSAPRPIVGKALADARPLVVGAGALGPAAEAAINSGAEVLVLTDGCDRDAPALAAREDLRLVSVGRPERNRAVVGCTFELRRPYEGSLFLRIREEDGTIREEDRSEDFAASLRPPARDREDSRGGSKSIHLAGDDYGLRRRGDPPVDALPIDDFIRLDVFPPGLVRVAVVTATGRVDPYLTAALEASWGVVDQRLSVAIGTGGPSDAASGVDVIICDPVGPGLPKPLLILGGGTGEVLRAPVVQAGDRLHPVMRGVDPAEWIVTRGRSLEARAGDCVLLSGPAGPLALAGERSGVRCVLLGFDPVESTLPLSGSWPVFLGNALLWLADDGRSFGHVSPGSQVFGHWMFGPTLQDAEESDLAPRVPRNADAFVPPARLPRGPGPVSRAADFAAAGAALLLLEWAFFLALRPAARPGRDSFARPAPLS